MGTHEPLLEAAEEVWHELHLALPPRAAVQTVGHLRGPLLGPHRHPAEPVPVETNQTQEVRV
eukprot:342567-Prorocentrum_minimum.AAC.3